MTTGFVRHLAFVLALALLPAAPALAQAPNAAVDILDFGLYAAGPTRRIPDAEQLGGERWTADGIRLVERTEIIPGQLGRIFGLRFRVNDPRLHGKPLHLRIRHPRLSEPSGRSAAESGRRDASRPGDQEIAHLFAFDHTWEIAEGDWTLQVVHEGRVLAEKKFRVIVAMY